MKDPDDQSGPRRRRRVKLRVLLLLLIVIFTLGRYVVPSAPVDPDALNWAVSEPIALGKVVTIELIRVNGAEPPAGTFEDAIATFREYVAGEVRVIEAEALEVDLRDDGALTEEQFNEVADAAREGGPCAITLVVVPALGFSKASGRYYPDRGLIMVDGRVIDDRASKIPFSRKIFWQRVILHELLHALHVPLAASHSWAGRHCTHPSCLLYPRPDARSMLSAILRLRVPSGLCRACRGELEKIQAAAGGRLFDPHRDHDSDLEGMNGLVRLNPNAAAAYTERGKLFYERGEYLRAIPDFTRALELDPANSVRYRNRAFAHFQAGEYGSAIEDFTEVLEQAPDDVTALKYRGVSYLRRREYAAAVRDFSAGIELERDEAWWSVNRGWTYYEKRDLENASRDMDTAAQLGKSDASVLGSVAWFLATCPEARFRDGRRAVELATQACELTDWRNAEYMSTLAAARAETGDFDAADEFHERSLALADESEVEELRERRRYWRKEESPSLEVGGEER